MNLQQLEYIVSVDTHRHFEKAAEKCFVTQATLSMMIKKLEQELDVVIFDRSKQPVVPTETGNIESLLKITELNGGITIVPQLATIHFDKKGKQKLRHFKPPVPVREISLVTYRHFVKKRLLELLEKEIILAANPHLSQKHETDVIAVS